jgi:hypothetical protein
MTNEQRKMTIELTPLQFEKLSELAKTEDCEVSTLLNRSVDAFIATYQAKFATPHLEQKLDEIYRHIVMLLVATMKMIGQDIYFSSLPLANGPLKGKLTAEGVSVHFHNSKQFAEDLLSPPRPRAKDKASKDA